MERQAGAVPSPRRDAVLWHPRRGEQPRAQTARQVHRNEAGLRSRQEVKSAGQDERQIWLDMGIAAMKLKLEPRENASA